MASVDRQVQPKQTVFPEAFPSSAGAADLLQ